MKDAGFVPNNRGPMYVQIELRTSLHFPNRHDSSRSDEITMDLVMPDNTPPQLRWIRRVGNRLVCE